MCECTLSWRDFITVPIPIFLVVSLLTMDDDPSFSLFDLNFFHFWGNEKRKGKENMTCYSISRLAMSGWDLNWLHTCKLLIVVYVGWGCSSGVRIRNMLSCCKSWVDVTIQQLQHDRSCQVVNFVFTHTQKYNMTIR